MKVLLLHPDAYEALMHTPLGTGAANAVLLPDKESIALLSRYAPPGRVTIMDLTGDELADWLHQFEGSVTAIKEATT